MFDFPNLGSKARTDPKSEKMTGVVTAAVPCDYSAPWIVQDISQEWVGKVIGKPYNLSATGRCNVNLSDASFYVVSLHLISHAHGGNNRHSLHSEQKD